MNASTSSGASLREWVAEPFRQDALFRRAFLWILLASVALRVFLVSEAIWFPNGNDADDYYAYAYNWTHGLGYMQEYHGKPDCFDGMTFYAYRMPGYPVILGITYSLLGWDPHMAMLVNIVADIITALCIAILGFHLMGRLAALWAVALWGLQIFWTINLLTESTFTAAFMILILLLASGTVLKRPGSAALFGIVQLVALMIRPIGFCASIWLGCAAVFVQPNARKFMLFGLALLPAVLGVSYWGHRNYELLHQPVLMSTNFGRHNASSFGISFESAYERQRVEGMNEAQINASLTHEIVKYVRQDPARAVRIYLRRIAALFELHWFKPESRVLAWCDEFPLKHRAAWVFPLFHTFYKQYRPVYTLAILGCLVGLLLRLA